MMSSTSYSVAYAVNDQQNMLDIGKRRTYTSGVGEYAFLTPNDIACLTSVGYKKALQIMKSSGFPSIKIGGEYRVTVKDYKVWVNQNRGKSIGL